MAEGDGAPVHVDAVHVRLQFLAPGEHDRRERLVDLHEVDPCSAIFVRSRTLLVAGMGPVSIVTGSTPTTEKPTNRGARAQTQLVRPLLRHHEDGGGAVGDLG